MYDCVLLTVFVYRQTSLSNHFDNKTASLLRPLIDGPVFKVFSIFNLIVRSPKKCNHLHEVLKVLFIPKLRCICIQTFGLLKMLPLSMFTLQETKRYCEYKTRAQMEATLTAITHSDKVVRSLLTGLYPVVIRCSSVVSLIAILIIFCTLKDVKDW